MSRDWSLHADQPRTSSRPADRGWQDVEPVYGLAEAAARFGVPRQTIIDWIDRGMRAFPLGEATRYRPRAYLIKESWALAFLEAHSVVVSKPGKTPDAPPIKTTSGKPGRKPDPHGSIIGPCPVSRR